MAIFSGPNNVIVCGFLCACVYVDFVCGCVRAYGNLCVHVCGFCVCVCRFFVGLSICAYIWIVSSL